MKKKLSWIFLIIFVFFVIVFASYVIGRIHQARIIPSSGSNKPLLECDFNSDGSCNAIDFEFFQNTVGACRGETDYHPFADVDADGCVTGEDQQDLFPVWPGT